MGHGCLSWGHLYIMVFELILRHKCLLQDCIAQKDFFLLCGSCATRRQCHKQAVAAAFMPHLGSCSRTLWFVLGESFLEVLTLYMYLQVLGSSQFILVSMKHLKTCTTNMVTLAHKASFLMAWSFITVQLSNFSN